MARSSPLLPPRVSPPDLPAQLEDGALPARGSESFQLRWKAWDAVTDAAHAVITECAIIEASVDRVDLTGATLVDVEVRDLRATTFTARSARLRRVRFAGGRIGTLDLAGADLDEVELRGVRIDYLSLSSARLADFVVVDSTIGTLDMPQASLSRVSFANTRADEVDSRGLRSKDLDLRGLEAVSYLDPASLRGATLSAHQVEYLAPALADALGIRVLD